MSEQQEAQDQGEDAGESPSERRRQRENLDRVAWSQVASLIQLATNRIVTGKWNYEKVAQVLTKSLSINKATRRSKRNKKTVEEPVVLTEAIVRGVVSDLNRMYTPLLAHFGFVVPGPGYLQEEEDEDAPTISPKEAAVREQERNALIVTMETMLAQMKMGVGNQKPVGVAKAKKKKGNKGT